MNDLGFRASTCVRRYPIWPFGTLILGLLIGLLIPVGSRWLQSAAMPAAVLPAPFLLIEWEYPGATPLQKVEGGSSEMQQFGRSTIISYSPNLYSYKSADSFESVWSHFAKLTGISDVDFKPGTSASTGSFTNTVTLTGSVANVGSVVYFTGDSNRKSVRSATIVNQRRGYTMTIFLSRGENDDQTHFCMAIEKKASSP